VPPRLLLPPQPLRQTLNLRTLPPAILNLDFQSIHGADERTRDAEASEEDDLHVRDEYLFGAPVALVGRGAAGEVEAVEIVGGGGEGVVLVVAGEGLPSGVVGVEDFLQVGVGAGRFGGGGGGIGGGAGAGVVAYVGPGLRWRAAGTLVVLLRAGRAVRAAVAAGLRASVVGVVGGALRGAVLSAVGVAAAGGVARVVPAARGLSGARAATLARGRASGPV
jgi:hypothetical protein